MSIFDMILGKPQPNSVEFFLERAGHAMENGSFWDAVNFYDAIVHIDPKYSPAWIGRGIAFEKLGYYCNANESFSKAELLGDSNGTINKKRLDPRSIDPSKRPSVFAADVIENPYGDKRPYFYVSEQFGR